MIKRKVLKNGITLLTDRLDYLRSACVGVFVESGAAHEPESLCGISHFIEHMLFKGTTTRSASDLAFAFEMIGGQSNAYTSKENTVFYAKTLDNHLPSAIELLADMVCNPAFLRSDVQLERGVILEEINMYRDSPEDLVADRLFARVWDNNALGREILGTPASLNEISAERLRKYHQENYTGNNTVISIAGNFDQDAVENAVEKSFENYSAGKKRSDLPLAPYSKAITVKRKEIEQNHLCYGFPGLPITSPDRFALSIASNILGAGMSSRLFLRVREQLGLVYSVYSFLMPHKNGGLAGIYSAHSKENEKIAAQVLCEEINRFVKGGVTDDELARAKESYKTNIVMGFESSFSRMSHMAKGEQMHGYIMGADEMIKKIESITKADITDISRKVFKTENFSVSSLGQPLSRKFYEQLEV